MINIFDRTALILYDVLTSDRIVFLWERLNVKMHTQQNYQTTKFSIPISFAYKVCVELLHIEKQKILKWGGLVSIKIEGRSPQGSVFDVQSCIPFFVCFVNVSA